MVRNVPSDREARDGLRAEVARRARELAGRGGQPRGSADPFDVFVDAY